MDKLDDFSSNIILHYFIMALELLNWWILIASLFASYLTMIATLILVLVLYLSYKCYWKPPVYIQEVTDIGYDHITKATHRTIRVSRTHATRKLCDTLPPPFPNGWFAVVDSDHLGVGDVIAVVALGQNLNVFRGSSGKPYCVDAYCPHGGSNVGIVPKGLITRSWETAEVDGAVWFWHDAEHRQPLWPMVSPKELLKWGYRGRNEFIVHSHIQLGPGHVRLYVQSAWGPTLITQSVTPLSAMTQRVVHRVYTPTHNALYGLILLKGETQQFDDVAIWNNKQHVPSPSTVKSDKKIQEFRAWFSQFYSKKSVSFEDATTNTLVY